jgi:hypothetical protein
MAFSARRSSTRGRDTLTGVVYRAAATARALSEHIRDAPAVIGTEANRVLRQSADSGHGDLSLTSDCWAGTRGKSTQQPAYWDRLLAGVLSMQFSVLTSYGLLGLWQLGEA